MHTRSMRNPSVPGRTRTRTSWGWHQGTGAHPGPCLGEDSSMAWTGRGSVEHTLVAAQKSPSDQRAPCHHLQLLPVLPNHASSAAEAQGPLEQGAGRTDTFPLPALPQQGHSSAGNRDQLSCRPGQDPASRSLYLPCQWAEGTGPCAVHVEHVHVPAAAQKATPFLHPMAIPPWPHHPLLIASSFPPSLSKQVPAQQSRTHRSGSRALQAQSRGWQGLHAAAARFVLVSVLGAGNSTEEQ